MKLLKLKYFRERKMNGMTWISFFFRALEGLWRLLEKRFCFSTAALKAGAEGQFLIDWFPDFEDGLGITPSFHFTSFYSTLCVFVRLVCSEPGFSHSTCLVLYRHAGGDVEATVIGRTDGMETAPPFVQ